jgi:Resolvase, N terminal domain
MRTSSASNVGADKDGKKRQRAAIDGYAKAAGYVVVDWYYDVAVKGTDIVTARPGFAAFRECIAGNGVRTKSPRERQPMKLTTKAELWRK